MNWTVIESESIHKNEGIILSTFIIIDKMQQP